MKKSIYTLIAACACAVVGDVFADGQSNANTETYQWQTNWFNSMGSGATLADMKAVNGAWTMPAGNAGVSVSNNKLVLDLDSNAVAQFGVTGDKANDTNTVTKITGTAKFYSASSVDALGTPTGGKFALAVVGTSYYVWYGSSWSALSGATASASAEVTFTAELDYKTNKLNVWIGSTRLTPNDISINAGDQIAGFKVKGCGEISSVDGAIQLAVAVCNDKRYGTVADAMNAASSGDTVEVVRQTNGDVDLPEGKNIKLADNGNVSGTITVPAGQTVTVDPKVDEFSDPAQGKTAGMSGTYTIAVKTSGDGAVTVELPAEMKDYKEIASQTKVDNGVKVTVQTLQSIVKAVTPDGAKALAANDSKLRAFLTAYAPKEYESAQPTSGDIAGAINTNGVNGIPLWQSYVMGVNPADSLKPVTNPSGDTATDGISLVVPALNKSGIAQSGDYTITYQLTGGDVPVGLENGAVKVPLKTGNYTLKASFN